MLQTPLQLGKMTGLNSTPKIRVLIVERHGAVRHALCQRLAASSQLEVMAAVNEPSLAIPYLQQIENLEGKDSPYTVVLLGLHNGTDEELFRTLDIVQQMVRGRVTVVALAPYADEVERLLLQQAGASFYLLKHIDSLRLIQVIESAAYQSPPQVIGH